MRVLSTVALFALTVASAPAQWGNISRSGFGNVVYPGTGGPPATRNPFTTPGASFGQRLAATVSGSHAYPGIVGGGAAQNAVWVPVAYPVYAPYPVAPPQQPQVIVINQQPPAYQPPRETVQINQYFGDAQRPAEDRPGTRIVPLEPARPEPVRPAEPAGEYYLIALKDSTVYSAVGYWVDGATLHYIVSGNVHNQVSMELIDRELTEQLNRDRRSPVRFGR